MVPPTVNIKRGFGNRKPYRIPDRTIEAIALKAKEKADPCLCEYYKYEQCLKGVRNALDTYSRRHSLNQDLRMRRILDEHIQMASIKDFEPYRTPEEITGFLRPILQAGFEAWETGEMGDPAQGSPGQVMYIPSNDKIDRTINTLGKEMSFKTLKDKHVERAHPNSQHGGKGKREPGNEENAKFVHPFVCLALFGRTEEVLELGEKARRLTLALELEVPTAVGILLFCFEHDEKTEKRLATLLWASLSERPDLALLARFYLDKINEGIRPDFKEIL